MLSSEHNDVIYETIVNHIIQKIEPPTNINTKNTKNQFAVNPQDTDPDLWKKIEDVNIWGELHKRISPEEYIAKTILHMICKRKVPLFTSYSFFRIKEFFTTLENPFLSSNIKEELLNSFCKFKQTYWAFTKLAKIWKIKHTPIRIQCDLYMNELDPSNPTTFQLIQPNGIYLFSLQNIARIVVDAITHHSGMFVEPLPIKNPYTNGLLSKCDLFNIYFSLKHRGVRISEMMERFFQCEFNVFEFRRRYETELRDIAIEQYAKNAGTLELAQDVDDMLRLHKMSNIIKICPGFPQKELVETMRPFLKLYFLERYSFSSMTRKYSSKRLKLELSQFVERNPIYGRKITSEVSAVSPAANPFSPPTQVQSQKSTRYITETVPHIFYCKSQYMETHIFNEDTFDRYIDTGDTMNTYIEPSTTLYNTPVYPYTEAQNEVEEEDDEDEGEDEIDEPEQDDEWDNSTVPGYIFSPHSQNILNQLNVINNLQLNSAALYVENSTIEQINERTRSILSRLGRLTLLTGTNEQPTNTDANDNNNNTTTNTEQEQEEMEETKEGYEGEEEDYEEEEEEEEVIIPNPDSEEDDSENEDWVDRMLEDNDSVS